MYTNGYKDTYYIYAHELTIDDGLGVCNPGVISEKKTHTPTNQSTSGHLYSRHLIFLLVEVNIFITHSHIL